MMASTLAACANYAGIHDDAQIESPQTLETQKSLPQEAGHWPSVDWAAQFGDAQLQSLIDEALKGSPTIGQARARLANAMAFTQTSKARTLPDVNATYSLTREQYSGTALVPPPYGGSWQTENQGLLSASYDLDLWGKNREAYQASLSQLQASVADTQLVRLTLTESVARTYNQLARLYALRDIAAQEVQERERVDQITQHRVASGLDTDVERQTSDGDLSSSRAELKRLDGEIVSTRYEIAALLGDGPDRGLAIARPAMGPGDDVALPDSLPADLVSRRPDIVAARWRVDSITHEVKSAKAAFYPDINLSAAIGLDAFGFGQFLNAMSRTASVGPAVHLPIFDGGELRAQLKGRYADFDYAVASYNQTLVTALSQVATDLSDIRSTDGQLVDAENAARASRRAYDLAVVQYKAGLTNQLNVLITDVKALNADQVVANLKMNRRDQQIALAAALGGGYVDASNSASAATVADTRRDDTVTRAVVPSHVADADDANRHP
ncbi:MAG TPA: efflux transporter outer membrane subunit [Pararobbsia sp.]|nr:efflux transporter outer membrane subunit [Pararobbsia sp.]